jgi:hypothetical protein
MAARRHPRFNPARDNVLRPADGLDVRRLGFDDQNVAIRQGVDRARVLEALRERLDLQSRRDGRRFSLLPADDPGEAHGREPAGSIREAAQLVRRTLGSFFQAAQVLPVILVIIPAQASEPDLLEALVVVGDIRDVGDTNGRKIPYRLLLTKIYPLRTRVTDYAYAELARKGLPLFRTALWSVPRTAKCS